MTEERMTSFILEQSTRVGIYCIRNNMTIRQLANTAIGEYLERYDKVGADNKEILREYADLAKSPWPRRKDDQEKRAAQLVEMERKLGLLEDA